MSYVFTKVQMFFYHLLQSGLNVEHALFQNCENFHILIVCFQYWTNPMTAIQSYPAW